jgi:hypothetical protein
MLYLAVGQPVRVPFERVANVIMLVFVTAELIVSFSLTRRLMRHQATQYYLNGFEDGEAAAVAATEEAQVVREPDAIDAGA